MPRRHDSLIPLSHDHHHALHNARLLRVAADGDDQARLDAAVTFVGFFRTEGIRHFREEEEDLFPRVIDLPGAPVDGIEQVLLEHIRLHASVQELERQIEQRTVEPEHMRAVAKMLRAHVRFEEDKLFPEIEQQIS